MGTSNCYLFTVRCISLFALKIFLLEKCGLSTLSSLTSLPNHTVFFPTLPRVGHDPFAVAAVPFCVTFYCCEIFLPLSSTKAASFDVGQLCNVPAGTGGEPVCQHFLGAATLASADGILCQTLVVHMPVGQVVVCVYTSTKNSVKSYLLSSSWRI